MRNLLLGDAFLKTVISMQRKHCAGLSSYWLISVFNRQSHVLYSNLPVPGNLLTDNIDLHEHSSPKMSGHLELKASHYRNAGHVIL